MTHLAYNDDSLAQLVEHSTFNAGVKGPSPLRITFGGVYYSPFFMPIAKKLQVQTIQYDKSSTS